MIIMISIRPNYFDQFKCEGKICGSRCCKGWKVAVDDAIYSKYCNIKDIELRQDILTNVENANDHSRYIKFSADRCAFLDDDYLCRIQKHCGEDYLTAICHSYPRVSYNLGGILEQSLTLTCPLAARLILLPKTPMEFEEVETELPRQIFDWTNKLTISVDIAVSLQATAISILQNRSIDFNERLLRLCLLLQDNSLNEKINPTFKSDKHMEIMLNIFDEMYNANLTKEKAETLKKIWINYHSVILQRLMDSYSHIFENYLANEFFMRCYPFAFKGGLWKNCKVFITSYKFVEFALVLTAISKNGFVTAEEFLAMIDAINEKLDHSRGGMNAICNFVDDVNDVAEFLQLMIDL